MTFTLTQLILAYLACGVLFKGVLYFVMEYEYRDPIKIGSVIFQIVFWPLCLGVVLCIWALIDRVSNKGK